MLPKHGCLLACQAAICNRDKHKQSYEYYIDKLILLRSFLKTDGMLSLQVTTLLSRHDKALAQGVVSEQQLQHLQQQVSNQGSVLRTAKEAAKFSDTEEAKEQVPGSLSFADCHSLIVFCALMAVVC